MPICVVSQRGSPLGGLTVAWPTAFTSRRGLKMFEQEPTVSTDVYRKDYQEK